jgi:hypothetical protein
VAIPFNFSQSDTYEGAVFYQDRVLDPKLVINGQGPMYSEYIVQLSDRPGVYQLLDRFGVQSGWLLHLSSQLNASWCVELLHSSVADIWFRCPITVGAAQAAGC